MIFYKIAFLYLLFYFFFSVFVVLAKIKLTKLQFYSVNVLLFLAILIIASLFRPTVTYDLYRYYEFSDAMSNYTLSEALEFGEYNDTIITNIYFYILSQMKNNRFIFSAIPTGITFLCVWFSQSRFIKKINASYRISIIYIILLIASISLVGVISGIRQNLAWAFLMIAVFYDFGKKDTNVLIRLSLYLIPISIHSATTVVVVLRLIINLLPRFKLLKYSFVLWPLLLSYVPNFYHVFPEGIRLAFDRLVIYTNPNFENYNINRFISVLILYIIFIYIGISIMKTNKYKIFNNDFFRFYLVVLLFGFASSFAPHLFSRIFNFSAFISYPVLVEASYKMKNIRPLLVLLIILVSIFLFVTQDVLSLLNPF